MRGALAMVSAKARKKTVQVLGRPRTMSVQVAHPTVPLATETVQRVIDPIEMMRARRQLAANKDDSERAYMAAQKIRAAWDIVYGSCGGSMDFDRVRGGGYIRQGHALALTYRTAAGVLLDVKRALLPRDHRVVELVVCEGRPLAEVASLVFRCEPTRYEIRKTGDSLRQGLSDAASIWWPADGGVRKIRAHREEVEYSVQTGTIDVDVRAVHANGRRVWGR